MTPTIETTLCFVRETPEFAPQVVRAWPYYRPDAFKPIVGPASAAAYTNSGFASRQLHTNTTLAERAYLYDYEFADDHADAN